jgi:hypothetical protein
MIFCDARIDNGNGDGGCGRTRLAAGWRPAAGGEGGRGCGGGGHQVLECRNGFLAGRRLYAKRFPTLSVSWRLSVRSVLLDRT